MTGRYLASAAVLLLLAGAPPAFAATYVVATDGDDASGDGSEASPWATIAHAVNSGIGAEGGHTIVVRDGTYNGPNVLSRGFPALVTIQAEHDYRAVLTNLERDGAGSITGGSEALQIYIEGPANLAIQGFVITNDDPAMRCAEDGSERGRDLVHIQDATDILFRNNIVFGNGAPGTCNDMVKINRGGDAYYPRNIVITGNVFYDHPTGSGVDLIDSVRPGELDITENIFFVRDTGRVTQSFITIKREVPEAVMPDGARPPRSPRFIIARNVFLNWGGKDDQAFVQFGEDGAPEHEVTDSLIENNLFIGNSSAPMAAPVQLKGVRGITIRANTAVGDMPGGAFGLRVGTEGDNPTVADIAVYGNIWCDPAGTMGDRFINTYGDVDASTVTLEGNLFWNEGNPLPTIDDPAPSADPSMLTADPQIRKDQSGIVLPAWDAAAGRFPSGSLTIREEFERLVHTYGSIPEGSPAIGAAPAALMPAVDILGKGRDENPDTGAYEQLGDVIPEYPDVTPELPDPADPAADAAADTTTDGSADAGDGDEKSGCGCAVAF